ncbi:hypothetical protein ACFPYI_00295 [Halomarina salina]|uniref:Lipoprotein n=1 Tax=Halomarina salina TaxID=1872699 RepID=A0ABD5RHE7_9EURY|nr:hypothetical protein [Halomarina salina]
MRRRQVLALAAVGFTGCLSDTSPADTTANGTTTSTTGTKTATTTDTMSPSTTVNDSTATPTPPNIEAYPGDCPSYGDNVATVVCSEAAPDDVPLRMTPSEPTVDLSGSLTFTLRNETDAAFQTNHYAARLHKQVDDEWFHVAPTAWPQPLTPLSGDDRHSWTVYPHSEPIDEPNGAPGDSETTRIVGGLGGGRYVFGNLGWFAGGDHEEQTAAVATVEIQGPPAELTTTGDVTDVSVDGETLGARWTAGREHEYSSVAAFVLRTTDASTERRLITEQLLQPGSVRPRPLRDALALLTGHDVETVRLTGVTGSTPPFGLGEPSLFEYHGTTYEMSAEKVEGQE